MESKYIYTESNKFQCQCIKYFISSYVPFTSGSHDHKTFEYNFQTRTPKLSNQTAVLLDMTF